ncbi:MAG: CNNM domain-containing protein [Rhodothermales bacterium]
MALLIFYVALALGVSFLCSVMEAVLLSITPSYVAILEQEKHPAAVRINKLKADIDGPLSAILSLNTIAHTIGAAGAGAQAAKVFGDEWLGLISAILTLLILIISEIIPKTLGALYWRGLAPSVTRMLVIIMWPMKPLVWLSKIITKMMARGEKEAAVSREELSALAELGRREGTIELSESQMVTSLLAFNGIRAKDVMTPRTVIHAYPQDEVVQTLLDSADDLRFSRIPIYGANVDDIKGYVLKDDVLLKGAQDQFDLPLKALRRDILTVPESLPLPELFERMLEQREHIALVVGEYGGTAGIVSMEDVVETLLGMEIVDEIDSEQDMQEHAREQWQRRAKRIGLLTKALPTLPKDDAES